MVSAFLDGEVGSLFLGFCVGDKLDFLEGGMYVSCSLGSKLNTNTITRHKIYVVPKLGVLHVAGDYVYIGGVY